MKNIEKKTMVFEEIMFLARVASRARFWTLLASLLGAFWPSRWLKPVLEFLLERPRAVQDNIFGPWSPPRALQEASKRLQEAPKSTPRGLPNLKRLQDASKRPRGTDFDPFGEAAGPPEAMKRLEHNCTRTPKQTSKERAVAGIAGWHLDMVRHGMV